MPRQNYCYIIMGNRGTGKTDFIKNTIAQLSFQFAKTLIVDLMDNSAWRNFATHQHPEGVNKSISRISPNDIKRFRKGIALTYGSDIDYIANEIDSSLHNSILVFEDSTKYIGSVLPKPIKKIVLDSKQKNLDIFFVFHSLVAVPPELVRICNIIILFKTNDGKISKQKYPFPEIHKAAEILRSSLNRFENKIIQIN